MSLPDSDKVFAGSVPQLYDEYLLPLIFDPYAIDISARTAARRPGHVLEIAAGTGAVTRHLATDLPEGSTIVATDLNPGMIARAREVGTARPVEWQTADAMKLPFADASFDAVVASQCWMYFDVERTLAQVRRVLRPGGVLVTTHFSWLPRADPIARASEALVLGLNPAWQGADWSGRIATEPAWAAGRASVAAMFWFDADVPFSRADWRGRMRACRGVGASLPDADVAAFDAALDAWLQANTAPTFTVRHRIDAHLFTPWPPGAASAAPARAEKGFPGRAD